MIVLGDLFSSEQFSPGFLDRRRHRRHRRRLREKKKMKRSTFIDGKEVHLKTRRCTAHQDSGITGHDIEKQSGTLEACCDACAEREGCTAAVWREVDAMCYLKGGTSLKRDAQPAEAQSWVLIPPPPRAKHGSISEMRAARGISKSSASKSGLLSWDAGTGVTTVRPRFWTAWFWRRLMGRTVLRSRIRVDNITATEAQNEIGGAALCSGVESEWEAATANERCVRVYAHCLARRRPGDEGERSGGGMVDRGGGIGIAVVSLSRSTRFKIRVGAWLAQFDEGNKGGEYDVSSWSLRGSTSRGLSSESVYVLLVDLVVVV